jgi:hypothetical protein
MNKAGSRAAASRKSGNIVDNCFRNPALEAEACECIRRGRVMAVVGYLVKKIKNHRQGIAGGFGGLA